MATYLFRRLLSSALVVLASTFVMYVLVDLSIDPLSDLRTSTSPNKDVLIANRIEKLNLDQPVVVRYLDWARGASGCLYGQCDLGSNFRTGEQVTGLISGAIATTLLLVTASALLAILLGVAVGYAWGGPDRGASARTAGLTAVPVAIWLFLDRVMRAWPLYVEDLRGRPIQTVGRSTPNLDGDFWITSIDLFSHLLLPSITLLLISFAGYTRYSRASMLEVMNSDYIRTARAKGLNERTVVMRHAFRNSLLPLASIVPVDIITLAGGAVITESIFSWFGMGKLFIDGLAQNLIDPVMAFILVVGILAVVANFVADLAYAVLDPRIRVS